MKRFPVDDDEFKVESKKPTVDRPESAPKNPFNESETKKYTSPLAETIEDIPLEEVYVIPPKPLEESEVPSAKATSTLGDEWIRQELPSHCIPYDFKEVFLRPLKFTMLGKIHAANVNKSYTMLLDALNACVSVDIRDLTPADLTFAMYWIRDNSYPKSPLKFKYVSRYGNNIDVTVRQSDLEIKELQMTKAEYKEWQEKGFTFPRVRDMELLFGDSVSEDVRYLLEYAQYVYLPKNETDDYEDYAQRKIDKIENELGLDSIGEIEAFSELITHGVVETVKFKDTKFKPEEAIKFFKNKAKEIRERIVNIPAVTHTSEFDEQIISFLSLAEEFETEANEIQEKLDKGEKVEAKEEVVEVSITSTDFFPPIRSDISA